MSHLSDALLELNDNLPGYELAAQYYHGTSPEVLLVSGRTSEAIRDRDMRFRVNYLRTVVTQCLNRLEINAVTSTEPQQLTAIEEAWRDNNLGLEARGVHEAALVFGDTYVVVWPSEEEGKIDIAHNTPLNVRMIYENEDPRIPSHAIKAWMADEDYLRVNLYYADRVERWISNDPVKRGRKLTEEDFVGYVDDEEQSWPIYHDFGRIPVVHFRTSFPHGRPEHRDAYGPQDLINKFILNQAVNADFVTLPQRWILKEGELAGTRADAELGDASGSTANTPTPGLKAAPGGVWEMSGVKAVGEFAAADPKNFLDPIIHYVNAIAQVSDTPLHAFMTHEQPSGEARRRAEAPLVRKVENRQLSFGAAWKQVFHLVLVMQGYTVDDETISVSWQPAETIDQDEDAWNGVAAKIAVGVPRRIALMEAGYTADEIDSWIEQGLMKPDGLPEQAPIPNPEPAPFSEEEAA